MGLFSKKQEKKSDEFYWENDPIRYETLQSDPEVRAMETQLTIWMNTDEGWDQFTTIFVDAPVIVAKTQKESSTSEMLNSLTEYIGTQDRLELVQEGMLRAAAYGYAIGVALPYSKGYRPQSPIIDSRMLADETARLMSSDIPPSDVEWYGYVNRSGITVYQMMLKPLGEYSDNVLERSETAILMMTGRWFIRYGIALAKAQMKMENPN